MSDFYNKSVSETLADLGIDAAHGLTDQAVAERQGQYGKNELPTQAGEGWFKILLAQFTDIMVVVLIAAGVISALVGDVKDTVVILAIVVLNAALGFYQEYQAEQALAALSAMQMPLVRVRRGGHVQQVGAADLVPGDIVLIESGDRIAADGRLIEAANLQVEESAMTGESVPVEKNTAPLEGDSIPLAERRNMVFMGTAVAYGRGELAVTATGLKTELGNIATMLRGVEQGKTPLQARLESLGKTLAVAALVIVAIVFVAGVLRGNPVEEMLLTAISLAVAAVPEGLPAVITIALSLGASRMVRRRALIRRLPAVETLGSVTTICSDKTGTLTRNEMTVTSIALPGHPDVEVTGGGYQPVGDFLLDGNHLHPTNAPPLARLLMAGALCTDAYLEQENDDAPWKVVGDTTEGALLVAARKAGWSREQLEEDLPRVAELPFSSERKAMTTIHDPQGRFVTELFERAPYVAFVKGAPDRLLEWATYENKPEGSILLTPERRQVWRDQIDRMAGAGMRVLAVGYRTLEALPESPTPEALERDLVLLGLFGIVDPPRTEAARAVEVARRAGIRPVMITGDHKLTAESIAHQLGILREGGTAISGAELDAMSDDELYRAAPSISAYARVSPEHKLRVVKALQRHGEIVAMTGDGVNDAPALKQADIGVAMGITGTDVSKGAADMVLTDDNFASIVAAVEEGRTIYDNIRKFVRYLLSTNAGEIVTMFAAIMIGLKLPLLAIQLLWINLVTDGLPAIALGFEPAEKGTMNRPPRSPKEGILARGVAFHIIWVGLFLGAITLIGYLWAHAALGLEPLSPTLGLENLSVDQLANVVGVGNVPSGWATLSVGARLDLLNNVRPLGSFELGSSLLDLAEALPRTIAFTVLALAQIAHVTAIHGGDASFFRVGYSHNRLMMLAVATTLILQLLVIYAPFLQSAFNTVSLTAEQLGVSLLLAFSLLIAVEIEKWIRRRRAPQAA